jgi:hypothetical protein
VDELGELGEATGKLAAAVDRGELVDKLGELGEAIGKLAAAVDRVGRAWRSNGEAMGKQWGSWRRRWTELGSWWISWGSLGKQ